jgi:aspartate/methionine/tyrosine aminotransferase
MNPQAEDLNGMIRSKNPAVYELLSERGKKIYFPKLGILAQSADANGTKINATIGAAIEDDQSPMRLEAIASKIGIAPNLAFPYAPSFGRPDLRSKWKSMIYEKNPSLAGAEISMPIVTNALTHGVSMAGYLFLDEGDEIISPDLFWDNYDLILTNAYGANITTFNTFKNGGFDLDAFDAKLNEGAIGKKVVILNFPNNPSGYSPTVAENKAMVEILTKAAEKGNKIVVFCDDAYFGLVFEEAIERESIFALLSHAHENILALKLDGPTKEDYVWGFRVGFMTYGIKGGDAQLYAALENKTAGAVRGNISNASNLSQSLLLQAYNNGDYQMQKEAKFNTLKERYDAVKEVLKDEKYTKYFNPLPYNSGYFMCVLPVDGIDCEQLRSLLIKKYSIGVINLSGIIRVAFAAVAAKDVKALFEGLYEACKELKGE